MIYEIRFTPEAVEDLESLKKNEQKQVIEGIKSQLGNAESMKTVAVSRRKKTLIALLKRARQGGMILRSPDGSEFILAEIDDFNREIELTRKNKRLMKLLDKRAAQTKTIGLAQVETRLGTK